MNLTKTILVGMVCFCTTISLFSANITIIESQTIHPLHIMDQNWQTIATNLGYTATISPQEFLNDINNLNNTDVLIISSGLINLPESRRQTIKQFVEQGGNLYVQSEYLMNLPGNELFSYLVNNLGGNFSWDGELAGSLAPMNVIGDLASNFNTVSELTYFWYGTYGSGDATIHSILEFNNLDWGFTFCPVNPTYGKIIATSDQDWVRTLNSEELIANILNYLVTHMPLSTLPTVSINVSESGPCNDITYTFNAMILNNMGGSGLQWMINGIDVTGETGTTFISSDLVDGDVVECELTLSTFCTSYSHTSNPILIAPINPFSSATIQISTNGNTFCENETVSFIADTTNVEDAFNINFQWTINGIPVVGANTESFTTSNLDDQDIVNCILTFDNDCSTNNTISATPISINITPQITPNAIIEADQTTICEGETITFTVNGNNLGSNPIFQWQIDGTNAGSNNPVFSTNILSEGQNITCTVTANQICAVTNTITTNTIITNVLPSVSPSITISSNATEICQGEEVTFTASAINFGTNPSFQWQINGLNAGSNIPEFTTSQLTNGQFVSCILTADLMCTTNNVAESNPVSIIISEDLSPIINIESSAAEICDGEEVIFTAFGDNFGDNPVFEWSIDGTIISTTDSVFITTNLNDQQVVTCQITNPDACASVSTATSNSISIKVNKVDVEILEIEYENCGRGDGMIEIEGIGGTEPYTYEWMNGIENTLLTELSYGKFTVTVTDAIGCSTIGQIEMGRNNAPEASNIIINKSDCDGKNGSAEIVMLDSTMAYSFEWLNAEGNPISYSNHAERLKTGSYSVFISNEFGCSMEETIIVEKISNIEVTINDDLQITLGESFQLETIVNTTDGVTYEWAQAEGLNCTTCPNPIVNPTTSTTYTLIVTNEFGCTASDEINIRVIPNRDLYIPNAFTPNNDGVNDFFTVYAGDNVRNIKSMHLFDRWGEVVFNKTNFAPNDEPAGWSGIHKGQRLPSGVYVYMIEVEYMDGKIKLHKGDVSITPQ